MAAEVKFQGRVIRVEREDVVLPNGRMTTLESVRHRGSVVILAQPSPERIIVIRQYRPVIAKWIWELPAGSLDVDEAADVAVVRECEEETGFTPARVTLLGSWYPTPGFCDEMMHFYRCEGLSVPTGPVHQDDDEQIEPADITLDELAAMIRDGRVVDMKTVVGLHLLRS